MCSKRRVNKKHIAIKVGDIFPSNCGCDFIVTAFSSSVDIDVKFLDEKGHEAKTTAKEVREGGIKNPFHPTIRGIGYIGIGEYKTKENGKMTETYLAHKALFCRCYNPATHERQSRYKDCTVAPIWHNWQNFAEWYESHESFGLGYHLDKDLLVRGNTVYSPETCVMLPRELNNLISESKPSSKGYPRGVGKKNGANQYHVRVGGGKDRKYVGGYYTIEEASAAYVKAKERYVKNLALAWANRIEWKAFVALMNWKVYPDETSDQQVA